MPAIFTSYDNYMFMTVWYIRDFILDDWYDVIKCIIIHKT